MSRPHTSSSIRNLRAKVCRPICRGGLRPSMAAARGTLLVAREHDRRIRREVRRAATPRVASTDYCRHPRVRCRSGRKISVTGLGLTAKSLGSFTGPNRHLTDPIALDMPNLPITRKPVLARGGRPAKRLGDLRCQIVRRTRQRRMPKWRPRPGAAPSPNRHARRTRAGEERSSCSRCKRFTFFERR